MIFLVVFGIAFVGIQYITKTGIFKIPGVVRYDEDSLSPEQVALLQGIFTDEVELDKDVTITSRDTLEYPELAEGEYIYSITVPVTDYYDTRSDRNEFDEVEIIPIE